MFDNSPTTERADDCLICSYSSSYSYCWMPSAVRNTKIPRYRIANSKTAKNERPPESMWQPSWTEWRTKLWKVKTIYRPLPDALSIPPHWKHKYWRHTVHFQYQTYYIIWTSSLECLKANFDNAQYSVHVLYYSSSLLAKNNTNRTGSPAAAAQSTHRMPLSVPLDQLTHMHGYMHALFCRLWRAPGGILYSLITKLWIEHDMNYFAWGLEPSRACDG